MPSAQDKLRRRQPRPRVRLVYDPQLDDPMVDDPREIELPFVFGVLADLSGRVAEERPGVAERKFIEIDVDNIDAVRKYLRPRVAFSVPNLLDGNGELPVDVTFETLEDFSPAAVIRKIPALADSQGHTADTIARQLRLILHHEDFRALEGTWRGLDFLITRADTSESLRVKVLDVKKEQLRREFEEADAWDQTALLEKIDEEYGIFGGHPYGCLIGDYLFDHREEDIDLLRDIARVAQALQTPFIAGFESWREIVEARDPLARLESSEYSSWSSLRDAEESRFLGLALPRVLARLPYSGATTPVEDTEPNVEECVWINASYAVASNIARAFSLISWPYSLRGVETGGLVDELPCCVHASGGQFGPLEASITERLEHELSSSGLIPFCERKHTDSAIFFSDSSVHRPKQYEDPAATATARFGSRIGPLLAASRLVHYLRSIWRDVLSWGSRLEREDVERRLGEWLARYVRADSDPPEPSGDIKPLVAAEVRLTEAEGRPGSYEGTLTVRYAVEGDASRFPVCISFLLLRP